MANNYALFSEKIDDLTDEELDWLHKVLHANPGDDDELPELLELLDTKELGDGVHNWPGFEFSLRRDERSLWFYASENYEEGAIIMILQAFLRRFRPTFKICISIAHYCDKMCVGEFGGSWLFITADGVENGSTWGELMDLSEERAKEKEEGRVRLRLTFDVDYELNGEAVNSLKVRLQDLVSRAVGDGMLTGCSEATVDRWDVSITEVRCVHG